MAGDSPPDGVDPGKLESYLSDQEFEVGLHDFTTPSNTIPATLRRAAYTSPSTLHHAATPSHHTI